MSSQDEVAERAVESSTVLRPTRPAYLSHVVLNTRNVPLLSDWWRKVTASTSMYDNSPGAAGGSSDAKSKYDFVSFDEEHHRMAFVNIDLIAGRDPTPGPSPQTASSLNHVAFTFASVEDLIRNYQYLRSVGILPTYSVHHGPTVSNYYHDPDGNGVELQIDAFDTREELDAWFDSGEFAKHHGAGPTFDCGMLAERFDAGDDPAWLKSNEGFIKRYGDPLRGSAPKPRT